MVFMYFQWPYKTKHNIIVNLICCFAVKVDLTFRILKLSPTILVFFLVTLSLEFYFFEKISTERVWYNAL